MTSNDVVLVVAAVVLVLLAGVLAGADAALSRVSRVAVDGLVREGRRGSERLKQVVADPARYLNVALFLRIAFEITAVVLVTVVALDLAAETWQAVLVSSVSMLVISYVLVGVAPRTLGRQHAARVALFVAGPIHALASFLAPLTSLLILVGNALTPGRGFREGPFTSEAELRDLVDLAEERSLIEDDERQMIHSVFELRRHDRPRGHGAAHRHGLHRTEQDAAAGAVTRSAQRVQPDPGHRGQRGRRGRDRLPEGRHAARLRPPRGRVHRAGGVGDASGVLRPRHQAGRRAAARHAGRADAHRDRGRRVRRGCRARDHRGRPRGDRRARSPTSTTSPSGPPVEPIGDGGVPRELAPARSTSWPS